MAHHRGSAEGLTVSVVIPCFKAAGHLPSCVRTLVDQTMPHDQFEAIFVFNGPDDGGQGLAADLLAATDLRHQILTSDPGASTARNVGTDAATGAWLTLLDVDDTLTPNYLAELAAAAGAPGIVPLAGIIDVAPDGTESVSPIHTDILAADRIADPLDLVRPLTVTPLKLIATEMARRHPFDAALGSGEDVALWTKVFEAEDLRFDTTPAANGAAYRRLVQDGSRGRQGMTRSFMVTQRLDVIAALAAQQGPGARLARVRDRLITQQADFVARYLSERPDEGDSVVDEILSRGVDAFPWRRLPTGNLLVTDRFPTEATVRHIAGEGGYWNVLLVGDGAGEADESLRLLTRDAVGRVERDPTAIEPSWSAPRRLVSLAAGPEPHLNAAALREQRGDIRWTAMAPPTGALPRVAALADEVVFHTPHQFTAAAARLDDDAREALIERSVVAPPRELPPSAYTLGRSPGELPEGICHVAYFGPFHSPGIADVVAGIGDLDPDDAARVRLHLFVPSSEALSDALADLPNRGSVAVYSPVPFLTALSLATGYDVLLVVDTPSRGTSKVNPDLPAQLADHRGAGRDVWAHAEAGSALWRETTDHRSRLGDPRSAASVLTTLSKQVNR